MCFIHVARQFSGYLAELNLFRTRAIDEQSLQRERWSTRLYLFLLMSSLLTLTFYFGLTGYTTTIEVPSPSVDLYKQLENQHGLSLRCPCSQVAVPHRKFVNVITSLHPICSSDFILPLWIEYLFSENISSYFAVDFRAAATGQFQILSELCRLATDAISDDVDDFYASALISFHLLNPGAFDALVHERIRKLQTIMPQAFAQTLKVARATTFGNQLISGFGSNAIAVLLKSPRADGWRSAIRSGFYYTAENGWCYCSHSATCHTSAGFYEHMADDDIFKYYSYSDPLISVDGWKTGCFPLETLLSSSLICFYDATCLEQTRAFINASTTWTVMPLATRNESRFLRNSTVYDLVQDLFIEQLQANVSFASYFAECRPTMCSYSTTIYWNFLVVITVLLAAYGGLTLVLRLTVPYVVAALYRAKAILYPTNPLGEFSCFVAGLIFFLLPVDNRPDIQIGPVCRQLCHRVQTLNLFVSRESYSSPEQLHRQRLSTRLYLLLLTSITITITLYVFLSEQNQTVQVSEPTLDTYERLLNLSSITLRCSCSEPAVAYQTFMQLTPRRHPVCDSDFVSDAWINWLFNARLCEQVLYYADFRVTSSSAFTVLADLCALTNDIVNQALDLLYDTQFISAQLQTPAEFASQMANVVDQFEALTPGRFLRVLDFIRNMTHVNQLVSSSRQNWDLNVTNTTTEDLRASMYVVGFSDENGTECSCATEATCKREQSIFQQNPQLTAPELRFIVPGFFMACFPLESLLQSTLECFHSSACLENLRVYMTSSSNASPMAVWNFTALNAGDSHPFLPNATIGYIINSLFIKSWLSNISYASYFSECHPSSCTYTVMQPSAIILAITRVLGFTDGLSLVLGLCAPFIIDLVRRRREAARANGSNVTERSLRGRLSLSIRHWYQKLLTLNRFENHTVEGDEEEIRFERWTTRLYLLLLLMTLLILGFYTGTMIQASTVSVDTPLIGTYQQLQRLHKTTLVCACSQLYIPYEKFITMTPLFHPICSSDFVSSDWTEYLFQRLNNQTDSFTALDFRAHTIAQFQAITAFCKLTTQVVHDELQQFLQTKLVTAHLISSDEFTSQMQSAIESFQIAISRAFLRTMQLVRGTTQGNALLSAYTTNWRFAVVNKMNYATIYTKPQKYGNCSCATNPACTQPAVLGNWTVPGFRLGCLPVESLLQSTFLCLYDVHCVNYLTSFISNATVPWTALNDSATTSFTPSTTVKDMIEDLFVDSWTTKISYDSYFNQCRSSTCIYTLSEGQSATFIFMTLVGLYGSLTIILGLFSPLLIKMIRRAMRFTRGTRVNLAPASTTIVVRCNHS